VTQPMSSLPPGKEEQQPPSPLAPGTEGETDAARRTLWLFVAAHVAVWTLLPALLFKNAPLDVVEMRYLGSQWMLGYHKHPPLASWIGEGAALLCGGSVFGIYLAAQLSMACVFWAVWRLGRELVSPRLALLGACLLECCYFYTFYTTEFNNNIALYPFWTLTILFLYWALDRRKNRYWIAAGAALGLGCLTKYSAGLLALSILMFLVFNSEARKAWLRPGPYLMALMAAVVFSPHLVWLIVHRFPTLDYVAKRSHAGPPIIGYLYCPLDFVCSQLLNLLPIVIAVAPLTGMRWRLRDLDGRQRFQRSFLALMVLGPFLIYVGMAIVTNKQLLSAWGSHLWMFFGLLVLFCIETHPVRPKIRAALVRCVAIGAVFVAATVITSISTPYVLGIPLRIHYPGPAIAAEVQKQWQQRYDQPLVIVGGDWWLASLASLGGPRRPQVYGGSDLNCLDMGPLCSGWITDDDLLASGAVLVWDARRSGKRPDVLAARFPAAEFLEPVAIAWLTDAKMRPLQLGMAILPPLTKTIGNE
jgi:4-amino-4-deoxy-L-arabinose transferase-like glycosyltransferase